MPRIIFPPGGGGGGGGVSPTISRTTDSALATGSLVAVVVGSPTGNVALAHATTAGALYRAIGASSGPFGIGAVATINTIQGNLFPVAFAAAPAAADNGKDVFLSLVAGFGTLVAPSASGQAVVRIGVLVGADGVTTTPSVIFMPEIVALIP
jgi:hypothetical protein